MGEREVLVTLDFNNCCNWHLSGGSDPAVVQEKGKSWSPCSWYFCDYLIRDLWSCSLNQFFEVEFCDDLKARTQVKTLEREKHS